MPIRWHPTKDESFVVLRAVIESVALCPEEGRYGVDIPRGVWHNLESLAPGSVIFECKGGPFVRTIWKG